eukprot:CAMPEP_0182516848 /NCGR_PEP_ID=MMETSP1321-20130603/41131_1 /TAXON_ID=91990 /ORGANISM="Bolidomonas sp., Strain RCC1657" /LENGTH=31 /DNA_ID= /DNA_START= /DNA_END= /DNA_ORIENTATION=
MSFDKPSEVTRVVGDGLFKIRSEGMETAKSA